MFSYGMVRSQESESGNNQGPPLNHMADSREVNTLWEEASETELTLK